VKTHHPTISARTVAAVLATVAATLAAMSSLHLAGVLGAHVGGGYNATAAGVAEAVIGAVLAVAAVAMTRRPAQARPVGLAANGFAIAGFAYGLSITAAAGYAPDIAYHAAVLPVLVATELVLAAGVRHRPAPVVP
jgi:hypothetical protein